MMKLYDDLWGQGQDDDAPLLVFLETAVPWRCWYRGLGTFGWATMESSEDLLRPGPLLSVPLYRNEMPIGPKVPCPSYKERFSRSSPLV